MPKAVGIDLGTTNSVVSVLEAGDPVVIPNAEGSRTTPSVVAFAKNGEVLVGEVAKRQAITNPDRTIRSVKRHMGTGWSIDIDGKAYTAQEISARTLHEAEARRRGLPGRHRHPGRHHRPRVLRRRRAHRHQGGRPDRRARGAAHHQRAHRGRAGLRARERGRGRDRPRVRPRRRHLRRVGPRDRRRRVRGQVHPRRRAPRRRRLGPEGHRLAGRARSRATTASTCPRTTWPCSASRRRPRRPRSSCRRSSRPRSTCRSSPPAPTVRSTSTSRLSRAKFQELTADLLERCRGPFEQAIKDAGLTKGEIDHVILVGGSTRMPAVVDLVQAMTGKEPEQGRQPRRGRRHRRRHPGRRAQGRGQGRPAPRRHPAVARHRDQGRRDAQAHRAQHHHPHPQGPRPTRPPTTCRTQVEIHVLQGEREMAQFNKTLGKFQLVDLPPAPRGVPQIEVTFDIDANGIVHVSAKDQATGKEQSMTITGQSSLDKNVDRPDGQGRRGPRRGGPPPQGGGRGPQPGRHASCTRPRSCSGSRATRSSGDEKAAVESALADLKARSRTAPTSRPSRPRPRS